MRDHGTGRRKSRLWLILSLGLSSGLLLGGQDKTPLSIGTTRLIYSGILKEDRILSVRLPADYDKSRLSYPVIYLLYGDQTAGYFAETVFSLERLEWGAEIPDFLMVGIHNTDRYGNLLPVNFGGRPSGADAFMDFLEKELFPFIESEYRARPYRLLIGPQAGGPFGLYALACRPALFNAFILENPFSAPDSRELLKAKMREYAAAPPKGKRSVFINSFDRTGIQDPSEATRVLTEFLKEFEPIKPAGLEIQHRHLEEPTFIPYLELKQPLRSLFAGHYPPPQTKLNNLEEIKGYYREAGQRLGMEIDPPRFLLTIICDDLMRTGRSAAARELLEYSLGLRPDETNSLFRLGNLCFEKGDLDRAEQIFLKLQKIRPDPYFASRLEAIRLKRRD